MRKRLWLVAALTLVAGCGGVVYPRLATIWIESSVAPGEDGIVRIREGDTVRFLARVDGVDNKYPIFKWSWSGDVNYSKESWEWVHTFTEPGTFTVRVGMWDDLNKTWTGDQPAEITVVVADVPDVVVIGPDPELPWDGTKIIFIGGTFSGGTVDCVVGQKLTINVTGALSSTDGPFDCLWFGPSGELWWTGLIFERTFTGPGDFPLTLEIWLRTKLRLRIFFRIICRAPVAEPSPTVDLEFHPDNNQLGWGTTHATTCIASGDWSGSRPITGAEVIAQNGTYTLTCTGLGGSGTDTVVVTKFPPPSCDKPTVTLSASSPTITVGQSVVLNSSVSDGTIVASAVPASTVWSGVVGPTVTLGGLSIGTHVFTLVATNSCGATTKTVTVVVNPVINPPAMLVSIDNVIATAVLTAIKGPEANVGDRVRHTVTVQVQNGTGETLHLHFIPYDVGFYTNPADGGAQDLPFVATSGNHVLNVEDVLGHDTALDTSYFQVIRPGGGPVSEIEGVSLTVKE